MKNILKRIIALRDNNPNFAKAIEEAFPEIIDHSPFIWQTQNILFVKRQYPRNIYLLYFEEDKFKVRNLKDNKVWPTDIKPTGLEGGDYYLSEYDLNKMFKKSGTNLNEIRFIEGKHISNLHYNLF